MERTLLSGKQAGGQTGLILSLVFLFVFLFLAALYESWSIPVAVLISLPVAVLGAYAGVAICGLETIPTSRLVW